MIIVCSLNDLNNVCESVKPRFVISVIDPGYAPETPKGVEHHLKLGFDDIVKISPENKIFRLNTNDIPQTLPALNDINSIVEFTKNYKDDENIVIHCWCGVSRSMATATYLLCRNNTSTIEENIKYIRAVAPHANPNKLMIKLLVNCTVCSIKGRSKNIYAQEGVGAIVLSVFSIQPHVISRLYKHFYVRYKRYAA